MGKEEDSLLLFLSMEKPDLESCSEKRAKVGMEQDVGEEEEGLVASCPVFWTCVAVSMLILSLVSGAFQFCPRHFISRNQNRAIVMSPLTPVPYYEVPSQESGVVSSQAADGSFSKSFDVPRFSEPVNFRDDYQGQAVVHDGRAYLTAQHSTDEKGVVVKSHSVGRLIHSQLVRMKLRGPKLGEETVASFHTTFVFSIENSLGDREATGDGFAFVMVPEGNVMGSAGGSLGVMDLNKDLPHHIFAVEFDTWKNPSLHDISNNHVGINVNSMVSLVAKDAGYWPMNGIGRHAQEFQPLDLTSGKIQAWIDYDSSSQELTVSLSPILGWKPIKPLLKTNLDLSKVLNKYMSVGFSAATGEFAAKHIIHSWQFEKSRTFQHWQSANTVERDQVPRLPVASQMSRNSQSWQPVSVQRDHGSNLPVFRNPHKHRVGDSTSRQAVIPETAMPTMPAAERRHPMMGMRKSCAGYLPDFPTVDFPTFKEHLVLNSLWVLLGLASGLLFIHLVFITYHILVGCYDTVCEPSDVAEELQYCRVFHQNEETNEVGYVLVVSEEQSQQQPESRPLERV